MGILIAPGRQSGGGAVNEFNGYIRNQPWYQDWFASQGLDPNHVKLSDRQRDSLLATMKANGIEMQDGMKIDEAGNLNQKNTLGRNLIMGAAIGAGTLATMGALGPALGIGGGVSSAAGGGTAGAAAAGAGGAAAASAPFMSGATLASLAGTGAGLGMGIYGARTQANASRDSAEAQLAASREAGQLSADQAAQQLAFLREQEEARRQEHLATQNLNKEQFDRALAIEMARWEQSYGLEQARLEEVRKKAEEDKRQYEELQKRLAPYRALGAAGIGRIGNAVTAPAPAFIPPASPALTGAVA